MGKIYSLLFKLRKFNHIGKRANVGFGVSVINPQNIYIGDDFYADKWTRLHTWLEYRGKKTGYIPNLYIGNNVSFMSNCYISCMNKITIGDGCLFGDNVFVTDNFHGDGSASQRNLPPIDRPLFSKGGVIVGKNVWIGRNVCIMPGVEIGDGAIIGANSVVTKNVEGASVVAGVPARIIKKIE